MSPAAAQDEFRENKNKLIEQEAKKRMLEEMWQDRVVIAPEEQREVERKQQEQKAAVKALKQENAQQEATIHAKAKELEGAPQLGQEKRPQRVGGMRPRGESGRELCAVRTAAHEREAAGGPPPYCRADCLGGAGARGSCVRVCPIPVTPPIAVLQAPLASGSARSRRSARPWRTRSARSARRRSSSSSTRTRCSRRASSWRSA